MSDETDEALIERFTRGDRQAMEVIFDRHSGALQGFMVRSFGTKHRAAAEDAAQEVWIKVLGHAGSFKGDNFRAWLYAIARNACATARRRKKPTVALTSPTESGRHVPSALVDPAPAASEHADRKESEALATQALAVLSEEQREAFLLHVSGLTAREVAASLGINAKTATSRLNYAANHLKKEIARLERERQPEAGP